MFCLFAAAGFKVSAHYQSAIQFDLFEGFVRETLATTPAGKIALVKHL